MNNKIEITITNPDEKQIMLVLPKDANIQEWKDAFKTVLTFQGFHVDCINELFNEE